MRPDLFTDLPELHNATLITSDSREAKVGCIFVAIRGISQDGHQFISQVDTHAPMAIIGEKPAPPGLRSKYIQVEDSRRAIALLASRFYGDPSHSMRLIGVTGTSGKTTTTYILESIFSAAGDRVGVIGTVNFRFAGRVIAATHTTPDPVQLQKLLKEMKDAGCTTVIMEVSSHALKQRRTDGILFDGMIFTNLSQDHLDFHPDMEDYYQSKKRLFVDYVADSLQNGKKPALSFNGDDPAGTRLFYEIQSTAQKSLFKKSETTLLSQPSGIRGHIGSILIHSGLSGDFNISNLLGAVTLARALNIPGPAIERGISDLHSVPGRLQSIPNSHGLFVFVDYAHKPDALDKVLSTLQLQKGSGRIITVFGCGGDRDRSKRPVMGKIAIQKSDQVIITSDNPRSEKPENIIQEILAGIPSAETQSQRVRVELDRAKAIDYAIRTAQRGDLILIAGKGHEDYQIIGDQKIHFDDCELAQKTLNTL